MRRFSPSLLPPVSVLQRPTSTDLSLGFFLGPDTRELWAIYGWRTAAAPYAFLALSYFVVEVIVPLRDYYRKLNHAAQVSYGMHNITSQRLQGQYEAIAAQQGEPNALDAAADDRTSYDAATS